MVEFSCIAYAKQYQLASTNVVYVSAVYNDFFQRSSTPAVNLEMSRGRCLKVLESVARSYNRLQHSYSEY